ncbi:sulfotransferase [Wenzhouxiangella sp. C33]|uniref:Sulfotransferase n=1 Tax=Wenzhouxiangella limi TaxID=2707351 RepID=A0A845V5M8_9GAMM|nr:sulfotransferase [Wenzhouxiangella limi]
MRSMLDSHSLVGVPLESLFIIDYLNARRPLPALQRLLPKEYELKEWGLSCTTADLNNCRSAAQLVDRVHRLYLNRQQKQRWGQKTPRFVRYMRLLRTHFPGARFVHVVRDPRAVASSLVRSEVHRSTWYHAACRWKNDVAAGLDFERDHPDEVLRITYERLVNEPEVVLRSVCAFLDLDFQPAMLEYHQRAPDAYGSYYQGIHAGLAQPVSARSVHAWQSRTDSSQIALVESICGDLMDELGYARQTGGGLRPGWLPRSGFAARRLVGLAAQVRHYATHRTGYIPCVIRRKLALRTLGPLPVNR